MADDKPRSPRRGVARKDGGKEGKAGGVNRREVIVGTGAATLGLSGPVAAGTPSEAERVVKVAGAGQVGSQVSFVHAANSTAPTESPSLPTGSTPARPSFPRARRSRNEI